SRAHDVRMVRQAQVVVRAQVERLAPAPAGKLHLDDRVLRGDDRALLLGESGCVNLGELVLQMLLEPRPGRHGMRLAAAAVSAWAVWPQEERAWEEVASATRAEEASREGPG